MEIKPHSSSKKSKFRTVILIIAVLLLNIAVPYRIIWYGIYQNESIEDVFFAKFEGEVVSVDRERGSEIRINCENSRLLDPDGICNSYKCLAEEIRVGDSIFKKANSAVVFLKREGKKTEWLLDRQFKKPN